MLIETAKIYVVYPDAADENFARLLADAVSNRIAQLLAEHVRGEQPSPAMVLVSGFENLPTPSQLGGVSVVLAILPERGHGFTLAGAARIQELQAADEN